MTQQNNNDKNKQIRVPIVKRINWFIKKTDLFLVVYVPPLISLVLIAASGYLFKKLNNVDMPDPFLVPIGAIAAFIAGFGGLAQIIRREAPGIMGVPFRGTWAVFTGWVWLAICWISCIVLIFMTIIDK